MSDYENSGPVWERRKGEAKPTLQGLIAAIVILLPITAWAALQPYAYPVAESGTTGAVLFWGTIAGAVAFGCTFAAGTVWLGLYYLVLRDSGRYVGGRYFAVLLGVAFLVVTPITLMHAMKQKSLHGVLSNATLIDSERDALDHDGEAFEQVLNGSGFHEAFIPDRLATDAGLADARAVVKNTRDFLAQSRAQEAKTRAAIRVTVLKSDLSDEVKRNNLAVYDQYVASAKVLGDKRWANSEALLSQMDQMVAVLARSRGAWKAMGGNFLFARPGDLAAFNGVVHKFKDLAKAEQDIDTEISENSQQADERLRAVTR